MGKYAITISKYCRGSLTKQEIQDVITFIEGKFILERLLVVNEHYNCKKEPFEHLHISMHIAVSDMRTDNLNALFKKNLSFLIHKKDIVIKNEISDGWKEYCSKSENRDILRHTGITESELEQYNLDYKIKVQTVKDSKMSVVKVRIPKQDIPYVIANYINDNDLEYDYTLTKFCFIIQRMLKENYDFELRNMPEVKAKLDTHLGDNEVLYNFIYDQFKFIISK